MYNGANDLKNTIMVRIFYTKSRDSIPKATVCPMFVSYHGEVQRGSEDCLSAELEIAVVGI